VGVVERTLALPRTETARWLSTLCRIVLGLVWLWAAVAKMADARASVRAVTAYRLLPHGLVEPVAWGLPFVELVLAALLLLGVRTRVAAVLSLSLLALFTGAVASAWVRGLSIDCGCFGGGGTSATAGWRSYSLEIARDLGFAAMALWLAFRPASRLALEKE
jgi:uncharacterized membrane protein YphA (DoxX/SURF4 family)